MTQKDGADLDIPAELIAAFPPSDKLLFDLARRDIDDEMLMDIARADYGAFADEMFAELRLIRDTGAIPAPMSGQLAEVLCLTRWCDPDRPQRPPFAAGPTGVRGHQTRLFACATLLRALEVPENQYLDSCPNSTIAKCLASARRLGDEINIAVARLLTWKASHLSGGIAPVLLALGILTAVTRLNSGQLADLLLRKATDWVIEQDALWPKAFWWNSSNDEPIDFSIGAGMWQEFAAELKGKAVEMSVDDARTKLELCALLMETGY
ncbi:MAG: hypothetical protein JWN70_3787 [Planctomycetaceae bacterium]|nr:hypothetical protein [Planctomycetaceae bacterium]